MKNKFIASILVLATALAACKKNSDNTSLPVILNDKFDTSTQGWTGDFADYPSDSAPEFYKLSFSSAQLPAPLDQTKKGIRISGINHSDDLFMFMKKKITGLKPNQVYNVKFQINFASNAPANQVGVGGAPGESVYLGAGFSLAEPQKVINTQDKYYRMNIKKINQGQNGEQMRVIGNIANGTEKADYKLIQRTGEFNGKTDPKGEVWIIIGTDSGYEAETTLYYTSIKATFSETK
ncbi:hypothetical protein [Mucilaginibacter sp. OK098]|uniref:hypothetical protein n=1 Tax=Mucilaginibacter sp. OK098 TaxID=1855297 RepID=UPI00090FDCEA|nr:hypothetical protein [Mucilaginibacter sp. OK098]SHN01925.1 hypothetical protein SAMN05216524_104599 [Mucilaginibacter sp. OK098]